MLPEGVEIRVQGMGDHHLLSALGSPDVLHERKKRGVTVVHPPPGANHDLVLVNWSRMSRRGLGPLFWYLAFPFTLVNVAFEMRPSRTGWRKRVHVGALAVWSLILTGVTACWLIALSESLSLLVDLPDDWAAHRLTLAVAFGAGLHALVILVRATRAESTLHAVSSITHTCVVGAVAFTALMLRPGEWRVDDYSWVRFFSVQGPTNEQITSGSFTRDQLDQTPLWLDPVGLVSYLVLALCILVAAILLATRVGSEPGPAAGASFAVLLSGVLAILITSSVHSGVTQLVAGERDLFGVWGTPDVILPAGALMSRLGRSYPTTLLPGLGLTLLIVLVLWLLYWVFQPKMLSWFPPSKHRAEFLRFTHEAVGQLSRTLAFISASFFASALLLGWGLWLLFQEREYHGLFCSPFEGTECLPGWMNVIGWLAGISAVVSFLVIRRAHSLPALTNVLTSTADIAGFWPITLQPLGARTYRGDALEGITKALTVRPDQRRVLVGHSQGSVLTAWAVAEHTEAFGNGTRPALVTCGTPLGSLYFKFFPETFNKDLFNQIVTKSDGWANFWRPTDPIATALVGENEDREVTKKRNTEIKDPPEAEKRVYGHSDYWNADEQRSWIVDYLNRTTNAPPAPVAEDTAVN